jgi:hypothetical protein
MDSRILIGLALAAAVLMIMEIVLVTLVSRAH